MQQEQETLSNRLVFQVALAQCETIKRGLRWNWLTAPTDEEAQEVWKLYRRLK